MTAMLAVALVGCGSAAGRIAPSALGVSARDAYAEARTMARVWSRDARLRWVEGEAISPEGLALPETGAWMFHYTAPGQSRELRVRVMALETDSEERPVTSPPGYVIGDNVLGTSWIDSGVALEAVAAATTGALTAPITMLLVPTRPEQWIVRAGEAGNRWRVNAVTGQVLSP